jgi:hypothetical protein
MLSGGGRWQPKCWDPADALGPLSASSDLETRPAVAGDVLRLSTRGGLVAALDDDPT